MSIYNDTMVLEIMITHMCVLRTFCVANCRSFLCHRWLVRHGRLPRATTFSPKRSTCSLSNKLQTARATTMTTMTCAPTTRQFTNTTRTACHNIGGSRRRCARPLQRLKNISIVIKAFIIIATVTMTFKLIQ